MLADRRPIAIVLWLCAWAAFPACDPNCEAAVVVFDNRSGDTVRFSCERAGRPATEHSLRAGQVLPLDIDDKAVAIFQSEEITRKQQLRANAVYTFVLLPGGLDLEEIEIPGGGQAPKLPAKAAQVVGQRQPPDFRAAGVIPVKILVDEEQKLVRDKWEKDLRRTVVAASVVVERHCGLKFEVQAVETWTSDNKAVGPSQLLADFELKVDPSPCWLAIGFTSQQRAQRGQRERHPVQMFPRHILVREWSPNPNEPDRVELLSHLLGHYLGAIDSPEATSVMRSLSGDFQARADKNPLQFDARNTLVLSLVADQVRATGPSEWHNLPPQLQRQVSGIWAAIDAQPMAPAGPRRPARTAKQSRRPAQRYTALFVDGTRGAGAAVYDWGRTSSKPRLDNRLLLDGPQPLRWLRDDSANLAIPPPAFVEFVGGDRLPGKVVQYVAHEAYLLPASATGDALARALPAHLVVEPAAGLVAPRVIEPAEIRILMPWLRRIVWQRVASDRYEPGTLRLRSGGIMAFRSVQFDQRGIKLLTDQGVEQVPFSDIAELHLPSFDSWEAYFQQLAVLSPNCDSRLVRWETTAGLRATASTERSQVFDVADARSDDWIHMLQPAWSLDPLFVRHLSIRLRSYFLPTEFPLSDLEPLASRRQAFFGGAWDWFRDRNCQGGKLCCAGDEFAWGFGVQATSELQFELPAMATALRTRIGLDRLAGHGGCARGSMFIDSKTAPLFRSSLLVGSRDLQDSGRINLVRAGNTPDQTSDRRALILLADMAGGNDRPNGADPLDIRDTVDWLEPLIELGREPLQHEVDKHAARMIDSWAGWEIFEGNVRLVNHWDTTNARHPSYRLCVQSNGRRLSLARSCQVSSLAHRLNLRVVRTANSATGNIEVQINGSTVDRFDIPIQGAEGSGGRTIPLGKYLGQEIAIRVIQHSSGQSPSVEWQASCISD